MISFSSIDTIIILSFFSILVLIGFIAGRKSRNDAEGFLLSGRNLNLFLFVLVNVSTWYGGILGVGEFTYRYGLASWFTQGLPYYFFALLFAVFLAKKIRNSSLYTIPDKITLTFGRNAGLWSAFLVFVLVSPAPYLLMLGNLLTLIFPVDLLTALIIAVALSIVYLFFGGFRSNVFVDSFLFFVMFGGFIVVFLILTTSFGGVEFLVESLPEEHLTLTGGASPFFIVVWFLIALWTFADPGFHQRTYAAKNANIAKWGIIISILFWALFDFLTNSIGLYSRAILPNLSTPVLSYPLLAEKVLNPGVKGLFYAAMFATILSTANSFLFLSASTIGKDLFFALSKEKNEKSIKKYTNIGLLITALFSITIACLVSSVIEIWYILGSICIPGLLVLIFISYSEKLKFVKNEIVLLSVFSVIISAVWFLVRPIIENEMLSMIEPMIAGILSIPFFALLFWIKKRI